MVTLVHWKQIRYSQAIIWKFFLMMIIRLIIHLYWMCTPYDTHQKWSFKYFWLGVNSWNNKCVCFNIKFYVEGYTKFLYILFVCLKFFVPLENFSLFWTCLHCRWKAANFYLYSVLMAIKQCGSLECHINFDMRHSFIMVNQL